MSNTFTEKLDGDVYVYECENPALEILGNLPLSLVSNIIETKTVNLGYELNEGALTELGDMKLSEFISKLTCKTKDNYENTLQNYEDYTDKTLAEILGHKNPTITLKRYAHSMLEHKTEMMNRLGKLLL